MKLPPAALIMEGFEELRWIFVSRIFDRLDELQDVLAAELRPWWRKPAALQRLAGYPWWARALAQPASVSRSVKPYPV